MKKMNTKIAICYDFDGTLSSGYMQEFSFFPKFGINPQEFWKENNDFAKKHNMDSIISYMYLMLEEVKQRGLSLTQEDMIDFGREIPLFNGLDTWFDRINQYGEEVGVEVEHYIISSGLEEMIRGTEIAENFKHIFASSFLYDDEGKAIGTATAVNYTNKTQHLFRINKGIFNYYENTRVNQYVPHEEKYIHFSQMIYIGDGETDVPCMKIVRQQGGHALAVFEERKPSSKKNGC
ncbi:MAG: HAD family hydrolase [Alphaproteobacteria bacterium]